LLVVDSLHNLIIAQVAVQQQARAVQLVTGGHQADQLVVIILIMAMILVVQVAEVDVLQIKL
jgi:hypothetical protein